MKTTPDACYRNALTVAAAATVLFCAPPLPSAWAQIAAPLVPPADSTPPAPLVAPTEPAKQGVPVEIESINDPNELLLFRRGVPSVLTYNLRNLSPGPQEWEYAIALFDRAGTRRAYTTRPLILAAHTRAGASLTIDTKSLPFGVYTAKFTLKPCAGAGAKVKTVIERESYIGISSAATLAKAKDGGFLYGLDAALGPASDNTRLMKWLDVMGVDIIRHGFGWDSSLADIENRLKIYDAHGLKTMYMTEARYHADPARHQANIDDKVKFVSAAARRFPQLKYWELGNEPDLTFFYPGPIEAYNAGMAPLYRAIKAANPNAFVVNGGLSFAGDEATVRARRFIEILDTTTVDAIAYHGHGPGAEAERGALTRVRRVAREFGKERGARFVETESGVSAHTPAQEDTQARTVVQKMVFAQGEKMPFFIWFRLLMFEEEYGNLRTEQEPRPAVLAYRAMVEALRGYRYVQMVETNRDGVEAYGFAQSGGGPGRTLVLWNREPGLRNVYLNLSPKSGVKNGKVRDLFGNETPARVLPDGSVRVAVTESPVFLRWEAKEPVSAVRPAAPLLGTPPVAQLTRDSVNTLSVVARNPFNRPLDAVVSAAAGKGVPLTVLPAARAVRLAPLSSQTVTFGVRVGASPPSLSFPVVWNVYPNIDESKVYLAQIAQIPPSLAGKSGPVAARLVPLDSDTLNFDSIAGGGRTERAPAVALAYLESDREQSIRIGASADFWMEWFVNGTPVFSTLKTGNGGGYAIGDHIFEVRLKKGRNLLAVKVLAGSQGWKVMIGGPQALRRVQQPEAAAEHLTISLREVSRGGSVLAREAVEVQFVAPIGPAPGLLWTDPIANWETRAPEVSLGRTQIINPGEKTPDAKRWWQGESDLSARAYLAGDDTRLYLIVRVRDDTHRPAANASAEAAGQADSLQVGVTTRSGSGGGKEKRAFDISLYTIAQIENGGVAAYKQNIHAQNTPVARAVFTPAREIEARIERDEASKQTIYRVSLDRRILGAGDFGINFIISDNDSGFRKQFLLWRPGLGESLDTARWRRAVLKK